MNLRPTCPTPIDEQILEAFAFAINQRDCHEDAAEHIKGSIELAIDAINDHLTDCRTCRIGARAEFKAACPDGNQLWFNLDQAIALETVTAQI